MSPDDLASIPLLKVFQPEELTQVLQSAKELTFAPGKIIFRQGDQSRELYVLVRGKVRFEYDVPEGGVSVLSEVTDGMFFGELSFLHSLPRTATAIAEQKTELVVFEQEQLQKLIDTHPNLCALFYRAVAMELAKRLREATPRIL